MKLLLQTPHRTRCVRLAIASSAALGLLVALPSSAQAAPNPVPLGKASSFVVLAGGGVTNTGTANAKTILGGDLGTFPTKTITGAEFLTVNGTNHKGDAVTQKAKTDLVTGYTNAAGQASNKTIDGDLTGQTLAPGVYKAEKSIEVTGELILDAKGDPNAVFIFQAGSTLTTGGAQSKITLTNGASPCNVYWQVGSSATLGTHSNFVGSVLALESITATTGATVNGRLLARNGAVTLDTNKISNSSCATPTDKASDKATDKATAKPTAKPTVKATPKPAVKAATGATQVKHVPTGGVDTGDGSTGGNSSQTLLAGGLLLAGAGGATVVAIRRRRLNA